MTLGGVVQNTRHQLDPVQCGTVVPHRNLIFAALVAEVEKGFRQTTLCHLAQVLDVQCFARKISHKWSPEKGVWRRVVRKIERSHNFVEAWLLCRPGTTFGLSAPL